MAAPTSAELAAYRQRIDRFVADLDQEYYDHFAGLKDELELDPIYREYEDITTLEQARRMREAVDGSFASRELWRFACEGYLGALTRRQEEDLARIEPKLEVLPGWKSKTTAVTLFRDLPSAARDYIKFLEERCGAPSVLISTGPRREETIWREDLKFLAALPAPRGR